jgi:hypothetical protein
MLKKMTIQTLLAALLLGAAAAAYQAAVLPGGLSGLWSVAHAQHDD